MNVNNFATFSSSWCSVFRKVRYNNPNKLSGKPTGGRPFALS
ncbi:hypothetical protein LZ3411_2230 [Levilactobacillus zymae]|uniref:Uncharacterized protein n=1 Tax=Levilactobacillus zymae TaxID=267363 RepID=A0A1Y6JZP9_9LACO|nr:hypothetical protein LZ3411_2230 [Levilactobacillus zymae]